MQIFDASKMTLNYGSIFQCYLGHVIQIFYDSKMTFMTRPPESLKNLLNSIVLTTRHLNSATRQNYDPCGLP